MAPTFIGIPLDCAVLNCKRIAFKLDYYAQVRILQYYSEFKPFKCKSFNLCFIFVWQIVVAGNLRDTVFYAIE